MNWVSLLAPLIASLVALVIATFGDVIKKYVNNKLIGPKIEVTHKNQLPYNKNVSTIPTKEFPYSMCFLIRP